VGGQFPALDRAGIGLGALPDLLGHPGHALGHELAGLAFLVGDPADHLHVGVAVVPLGLQAVEVGGLDRALLHGLRQEAEDAARGDVVQPVGVAGLDEGDHLVELRHAQVGAQEASGLVLGPLGDEARVLAAADDAQLQAVRRAVRAGRVPLPEGPHGLLAADLHDVGVPGGLEVLGDERAVEEVLELHEAAGAPLLDALPGLAPHVVFLVDPRGGQELGVVRDGNGVLGAAHGDALELLVAEHGPRVAARGGAEALDDQAGVQDAVLSGRPDDDRADLGILHLLDHHLVRGFRRLAPHLRGVLELHLVVHDGEPDGLPGAALDIDAVPAGELDLAGQVGAALGVVDIARVGVLVDEAGAVGEGHRARHGADPDENEGVLVEGVFPRLVLREGVVGPEPAPADILLEDLLGNRPGLVGLLAEVDLQDLSEISAFGCSHGSHLPFLVLDFAGTTLLPSTLG